MINLIDPINTALQQKKFQDGLTSYTQSNCQVTLTNQGYRIYRPPNKNPTDDGHTMWGGLKLQVNTCHLLEKNHTYIILFKVNGKTSNAIASYGFSNQMGWSGGGLIPNPTNIKSESIPANFQGEKECFYKFTVSDDVYKTCTQSYSGFTQGQTYLSYRDFAFGFGYTNTGALGTDLYITNFRMYDITNETGDFINITKTGITYANSFEEVIGDVKFFKNSNEIFANEFYEI